MTPYRAYYPGGCQHCGRDLGLVEQEGGRDRCYCSPACRQAAYRARKAEKRNGGVLQKEVERSIDLKLHPMKCGCKRTIWTVYGNITIGGLRCELCGTEFKPVNLERNR